MKGAAETEIHQEQRGRHIEQRERKEVRDGEMEREKRVIRERAGKTNGGETKETYERKNRKKKRTRKERATGRIRTQATDVNNL